MPPERPAPPLVLGFDTSAAHCAAALLSGDRVLAERFEPMAKGQAERLMPLLAEVLAEGGAGWGDLTALGVGVGPGNFTGIRIAVSAARGLALARAIPAVGVNGFEALAAGLPGPVLASLDARRGAVWVAPAGRPQEALRGAPAEVSAELAARYTGRDAVGHLADAIAKATGGRARAPVEPLAVAIARLALARAAAQGAAPLPRPAPLYLRPADAAPPADPAPLILP